MFCFCDAETLHKSKGAEIEAKSDKGMALFICITICNNLCRKYKKVEISHSKINLASVASCNFPLYRQIRLGTPGCKKLVTTKDAIVFEHMYTSPPDSNGKI